MKTKNVEKNIDFFYLAKIFLFLFFRSFELQIFHNFLWSKVTALQRRLKMVKNGQNGKSGYRFGGLLIEKRYEKSENIFQIRKVQPSTTDFSISMYDTKNFAFRTPWFVPHNLGESRSKCNLFGNTWQVHLFGWFDLLTSLLISKWAMARKKHEKVIKYKSIVLVCIMEPLLQIFGNALWNNII